MNHLSHHLGSIRRIAWFIVIFSIFGVAQAQDGFGVTFRSVLSDFNGPVRIGEARLAVDPESAEVVAAVGRDVRVFNDFGMEVFSFRSPLEFGAILDVVMEPDGSIVTLAYRIEASDDVPPFAITRHDYRGQKVEDIDLSGLEGIYRELRPNRILNDRDGLVVASTLQMLAVRVDRHGAFVRGWDLAEMLEIPREDVANLGLSGLAVDAEGNLLATIGARGLAVVLFPDGSVTRFGKSGSAVGGFGNIGGIARDRLGRIYVADKIRGVILVFDDGFRFLAEFGPERTPYGTLGTPAGVWTCGSGRVYVTQVGERGVWAYDVRPN